MHSLNPVLIALLILSSCAPGSDQPGNATKLNEGSSVTAAPPTDPLPKDSSMTKTWTSATLVLPPIPKEVDSSGYIGELYAFPGTGEYYTSLTFLQQVEDGEFKALVNMTDSLIFEDIESRRRRLPRNVANRYFNLVGLDTIAVYTAAGYAGDARLVRVEQFDDLIEGSFIGVFSPIDSSSFDTSVVYCTSKDLAPETQSFTNWKSVSDSGFTKTLLKHINRNASDVWRSIHVRSGNITYSVITFANECFLIESDVEGPSIRKHITEDYNIGDIIPTHIRVNNRPTLLLRMGVNETDINWITLAVFDDAEYVFVEGKRLAGMRHW